MKFFKYVREEKRTWRKGNEFRRGTANHETF
jgi:hypothetical protein